MTTALAGAAVGSAPTHDTLRPGPAPLPIPAEDVQTYRDRVVWGDRVRLERLLRRWSQTDLARVAGVTQSQVSRLERGGLQHSRTMLVKIGRAFGIATAELFPFDDALDGVDRAPVDRGAGADVSAPGALGAHVPTSRAS